MYNEMLVMKSPNVELHFRSSHMMEIWRSEDDDYIQLHRWAAPSWQFRRIWNVFPVAIGEGPAYGPHIPPVLSLWMSGTSQLLSGRLPRQAAELSWRRWRRPYERALWVNPSPAYKVCLPNIFITCKDRLNESNILLMYIHFSLIL